MNTTKRIYESMYIVDANLTDEQVDSIIAKYTKIVDDQGGELRAVGRWDKRRLAYEVMGRREGLYILMFFEAEPEVAKELDRVYRISDDVFRHLITRVEPQHVDTSRIDQPPVQPAEPVAQPVAQAPAEVAAESPAEVTEEAEVAAEAAPEAEAPAEEIAEAPAEEPAAEEAAVVEIETVEEA